MNIVLTLFHRDHRNKTSHNGSSRWPNRRNEPSQTRTLRKNTQPIENNKHQHNKRDYAMEELIPTLILQIKQNTSYLLLVDEDYGHHINVTQKGQLLLPLSLFVDLLMWINNSLHKIHFSLCLPPLLFHNRRRKNTSSGKKAIVCWC